jgi:hypothetical protein
MIIVSKPTSSLATLLTLIALAGGVTGTAVAQEESDSLADHPLTGMWLAMANPPLPEDPQFAAPSFFGADGLVLLMGPPTQAGPGGVQYASPYVGTWEADGERRGHFTVVQALSDAEGTYMGSITVDGYPVVSEDGQTFIDDGSKVMVTIRDGSGALVQQFPGAGSRPITAIRMGPGMPGFPEGAAALPSPTPGS